LLCWIDFAASECNVLSVHLVNKWTMCNINQHCLLCKRCSYFIRSAKFIPSFTK
jgi:hypothetical protein